MILIDILLYVWMLLMTVPLSIYFLLHGWSNTEHGWSAAIGSMAISAMLIPFLVRDVVRAVRIYGENIRLERQPARI